MGKEKPRSEVMVCPVGRFFADLEKVTGKRSKFFKHMNQSRIEFLKAVRTLVDDKIEDFEKTASKKGKKKATKIVVE